ncbi:MAG: VCBS repeat-containing protein [Planctomycetota bacterium]
MQPVIACALALTPSPAQVGAYELVNSSVGHGMVRVEVGDLDQDGVPDLVTSSFTDDRMVLYRGLGAGAFAEGAELTRDASGLASRVVDLDADGLLDLVFGRQADLVWLRGLGGGAFAPLATLLAGAWVDDFELVDLDQDGLLDFVMRDPYHVLVAWGSGPAQFGAPVNMISSGTNLQDFAVADVDGDGRLDLVAISSYEFVYPGPVLIDGQLIVRNQTAPRTFAASVVPAVGLFMTNDLSALDVDLDGDLDLARADASGQVKWFRNDGALAFTDVAAPLGLAPGVSELLPVDLDGDGDRDLVYAAEGDPNSRLVGELLNLGAGAFAAGATLTDAGYAPRSVVRADLDLDGVPDLVHVSFSDDQLIWHRALPSGGYAPMVEVTDRFPASTPKPTFAIEDLDGDGGVDVVALAGTVHLMEQRPDGSFGRSTPTSVDAPILGFPELADIDGDGDLDLLQVQWRPPNFDYEFEWAPRIPGGFGAAVPIDLVPSALGAGGPRTVDWEGDGDLDVLAAVYQTGQVRLYRNLGSGLFSAPVNVTQVPNAALMPAVDLDGDGRRDLVLQSVNLPGVRTFARLLSGAGQLGPLREVGALAGAVHDLAWIDLDADGDLDALRVESANSSALGGDLALYENLGAGGFGPRTVLIADPTIGRYLRIQGVDWDVDGRQDLLVLDQSRRRVDVYLQTGPLQIGARQQLTTEMNQGDGIRVADLDHDGDLDLVVADSGIKALRVFENQRTVGQSFCSSLPNSTGRVAGLTVAGSSSAAVNHTTLNASELPHFAFGFFIGSLQAAPTPFAGVNDGLLCLAGSVGRYSRPHEIRNSGALGRISLTLDLQDTPTPTGAVAVTAGQTWYYQAWYRDANPGPTSNFTDGVALTYD